MPSAEIRPPRAEYPDEVFAYIDYHATGRKTWPLASIYRALITGKPPQMMNPPSLVTWTLRMLVDAGIVAPALVQAPKLPQEAPTYVQPVYDGFCFLLACKWRLKEWKTPYTWRFALDWLGSRHLTEYQISRAMKWLLAHGLLVFAGIENQLTCFLLGSRTLRQRLRRVSQPVENVLKRTQEAIIETVQTIYDEIWKKPCAVCERVTYAPDKCHQCLLILNAKLHQRRARDAPA
jgi:hypothetical protein